MDKIKKTVYLANCFLMPFIIFRTLMLQVLGWQFIALYLCSVLFISSLAILLSLSYIKNVKALNVINIVFFVTVFFAILIDEKYNLLLLLGLAVMLAMPVSVFSKKTDVALPFFLLVNFIYIILFILSWGWI